MAGAPQVVQTAGPEVPQPRTGGSSLDLTIGNAILRQAAMANAKLSQNIDVDLKAFMAKGSSLPRGGTHLPRGRGLPRGGATLPTSGGGVLYHTSFNRKLLNFEKHYGKFEETPVEVKRVVQAGGAGGVFGGFGRANQRR